MPFIYVTGAAGSGKSTLATALRTRGLDVYDEDDPTVGSAHNLQTGKAVTIPEVSKRDADWFSKHEWRLLDAVKKQLQAKAADHTVILVGNSVKPDEQATLFDKVIYLKIDEKTLRKRILKRTDNDYGHSEAEMQQILDRKRTMDDLYNKPIVLPVDATKAPEDVANAVQRLVNV